MIDIKLKKDFNRNILTLITGTTIAQAIPIAISPILTRIYTPNDFGVLALFLSLTTILSVLVTGKYEFAILLPKKDEEAKILLLISCLISVVLSLILLIIIITFNTKITNLLGNESISLWLYFIPLCVFLNGIYQSFYYWTNRKKHYKVLSNNRIIQSGITASSHLGIGSIGFSSYGLIIGQIFGQSISTLMLVKDFLKKEVFILKKLKILVVCALLRRYIKFPKIDIAASLINVSSHQLIHLFFNTIFNSTIAGYYYLSQRLLGVPVSIIASSITSVFQEKATKDFKKYGNAKVIFFNTFIKLSFIIVIPVMIFYFYAIDIFVFIFGENWREAGVYAQILSPVLFLQFISGPLSVMFYIGEKQELNLYLQFFLAISVISSFILASTSYNIILLLSFSFSLFYLLQLILSFKIAGFFNNLNYFFRRS